MLAAPNDELAMLHAERLFRWALLLNPNCSLCLQNLGDTYLRLGRAADAEVELGRHLRLLPRDSDAYFGLGNALRAQERPAEARVAFEAAVAITPTDHESHLGLAGALGALNLNALEVAAYRNALALKPADATTYINLGIGLSGLDEEDAAAEEAFRRAVDLAPTDARAPLNLGRYLAKLSRPAEAIALFYQAAAADAEYFVEVKLGVGTARAQQGRLREALEHFASASRMSPTNAKLQQSLVDMEAQAGRVEAFTTGATNAVADLCGTPCADVVDASGTNVCAISWADGCGAEVPPPSGFTATSTVAQLCRQSCAFYVAQELERQMKAAGEKLIPLANFVQNKPY
jgi:tetratricopeptide (TPR) repeat protein